MLYVYSRSSLITNHCKLSVCICVRIEEMMINNLHVIDKKIFTVFSVFIKYELLVCQMTVMLVNVIDHGSEETLNQNIAKCKWKL